MRETESFPSSSEHAAEPVPETEVRLRRLMLTGGVVVVALAVLVFVMLKSAASRESAGAVPPLTRIAQVPPFTVTERDGRTVTRDDLLGRIWIADFIFTRCPGPCPELSLRMRALQESIRKYNGAVQLVSFSVDPEYDRSGVLRAYADRYHADPDLWWFVTTDDQATMYELVQSGFLQAVTPAQPGVPIIHSTQFVLVDQEGYIRAWYEGLEGGSRRAILRDVDRLLAESAD